MLNEPFRIRVTCAPLIAPWLEAELRGMGFDELVADRTGVELGGTMSDVMRLNLYLRTAQYVLIELSTFSCDSPETLYQNAVDYPWESLVPLDERLSVTSFVDHPTIRDGRFANLKLKDAIVDRLRQKLGRRPDAGPQREGVLINLFWRGQQARLFLNSSGRKLSDRGYRKIPYKAPMQESLAAAVVTATGYDGTQPLVNPMCGSGTIALEAALLAQSRAPGLLRSDYGLMHVVGFDAAQWEEARRVATGPRRKPRPAPIIATDIDASAIAAAQQNARTAGVEHVIEFRVCDFAETTVPEGEGVVILNPEYGERMGESKGLAATYERIGDFFKQRCQGYTGYVFTGNPDLAKKIGLHASRRFEFLNADIECRLLKYEMYSGSRRKPK